MMRFRITFAKTEAMRYTGHLDLQRTWERTVRRARLPLVYSQGFNPRPKINLAAALPLGMTSSHELAEIWIDGDPSERQVEARLREAAPPGIEIKHVDAVDLKGPKLPNRVRSAEYVITLLEPIEELKERLETLLQAESLVRERRGKTYNLRPLIEALEEIDPAPGGEQRLRLRVAARSGATGRPDEVLAALEIPSPSARIHRTALLLDTPQEKR